MRSHFIHLLAVLAISFALAACGSSKPKITEPVGKVQLGMTISEVVNVLGDGQVVESSQSKGLHTVEVWEFPEGAGRIYVIRFIDGLVRRWEIQSR